MRLVLDRPRDEIIDETIKFVKAEKRGGVTWDQGDWCRERDCGTSMCVAGWVAHSAGYRPEMHSVGVGADGFRWAGLWRRPHGDLTYSPSEIAAQVLDLDDRGAGYLFGANRSKREVMKALRFIKRHGSLSGFDTGLVTL